MKFPPYKFKPINVTLFNCSSFFFYIVGEEFSSIAEIKGNIKPSINWEIKKNPIGKKVKFHSRNSILKFNIGISPPLQLDTKKVLFRIITLYTHILINHKEYNPKPMKEKTF
jgi:hypothetical protein